MRQALTVGEMIELLRRISDERGLDSPLECYLEYDNGADCLQLIHAGEESDADSVALKFRHQSYPEGDVIAWLLGRIRGLSRVAIANHTCPNCFDDLTHTSDDVSEMIFECGNCRKRFYLGSG